ncbi:MAG: hypothetical protein WD600_13220, partial [Pseudohongiella sp.]
VAAQGQPRADGAVEPAAHPSVETDRYQPGSQAESQPGNQGRGQQIPAELKAALAPGSKSTSASVKAQIAPADTIVRAEQNTGAQADPEASGANESVPDFAFSWFNVDKRLSVLAMMPSGADRLNSACGQMLKRILAALNPDFRDLRLQEHTFHWPFPGDLGLPTGRLAARQAVDGFVARRLREQPSAMLLILADDTPPFLYGDKAAADEDLNGALFVHRQFGFAMLRTHSLHAMDANQELKRSAWQAMKSLRDRLNRGVE